jgi:hypothetical protein
VNFFNLWKLYSETRKPWPGLSDRHQPGTLIGIVRNPQKGHELQLAFAGVRDLRIADLRPGVKCQLEILRIDAQQLEGLRYQVHNLEQDFTLSFYCSEFNVTQPLPDKA